jgi:hypothetical protein
MQQRTRRHLQHPGCGHGNLIEGNPLGVAVKIPYERFRMSRRRY